MTDLAQNITPQQALRFGPFRPVRLLVALTLAALAAAPGTLGTLTRELMTDAYIAVSVFVAATLALFYGAERLFGIDLGAVLRRARSAQVPIAAALGAIPGCGGAVVVVAAYSSGNVGFGAVVAALTATMGDAAFLLIATRPDAAVVLLPLSLAVGILSGWVIDAVGAPDWRSGARAAPTAPPLVGRVRRRDLVFCALAVPGLVIGIAQLALIETWWTEGDGVTALALAGTLLGLAIWASSGLTTMSNPADAPPTRVAEETAFISVWVIAAFLAFEYAVVFGGLDLATWFAAIAPLLPLIGVLIGFIPGCGPPLLITTLYINGVAPFSALIGNAISNDGDALFPAIAVNPRAAIMATLYSGIPALVVAYGFFFLAPGFLN